jgi:hypothetical protein
VGGIKTGMLSDFNIENSKLQAETFKLDRFNITQINLSFLLARDFQ